MSSLKLAIVPLIRKLSNIDKKIINILLDTGERASSHMIAEKLGLPRTTVQRRRNYLEKHLLEFTYSLNLKDLGLRRVDLLIYTGGGGTNEIAQKLLDRNEVTYAAACIGEHTVDLRAKVIIKDNAQLLDILEEVKAMANVKDVVWSEIVRVIGRKRSVPTAIIDGL